MIKIIYGLGSSLSSKNNKQLQAWQACFPFYFSIDVNITWFLQIRGNFVFQGYTVKAKQATFENYGLTVVEGGSQWGDGLYGWRFQLKRMNFGFVRHAFITNDGIENVKITYFINF